MKHCEGYMWPLSVWLSFFPEMRGACCADNADRALKVCDMILRSGWELPMDRPALAVMEWQLHCSQRLTPD